jgi:hypothetical protein
MVEIVSQVIKKVKNFPYHLIVMAIFPIISLYAHNIEQVAFASTIRAYFFFLSATLISFAIAAFIFRKFFHAALIVSYGLFLFYLVIPFQAFLIDKGIESLSRIRFLLPIFCLIFVAGAWVGIGRIGNPERVTRIFNLIALSTLILPLLQISLYLIKVLPSIDNQVPTLPITISNQPDANDVRRFPDVYYILLDAHGRSDEIKREYGYDNTIALAQLTKMGFYIAQCSRANYYNATWQSMFATLNMRFFDHEQIKTQSPVKTINDGFYAIKNNTVLNKFKQFGYKYVSFNTMYDFLNFTNADIYYDFVKFPGTNIKFFNRFESQLLDEIPIALINKVFSTQKIHYENNRQILNKLPQIPQEVSSPKFVYAHIMVPHFPYVFSSTGQYIAEDQDQFTAQKYVDQVAYIDEQMVSITERIIENSNTPPIIIIQGDHGFSSSAILNAYYLPGVNYSENLYPSITPINSFRLIFKLYFDQNMELLPDNLYHENLGSDEEHQDKDIPYIFSQYTVTDNCSDGK